MNVEINAVLQLMSLKKIRRTNLAKSIGMSNALLSNFLNGKGTISLRRLRQIAEHTKTKLVVAYIDETDGN